MAPWMFATQTDAESRRLRRARAESLRKNREERESMIANERAGATQPTQPLSAAKETVMASHSRNDSMIEQRTHEESAPSSREGALGPVAEMGPTSNGMRAEVEAGWEERPV